MSVANQVNWTQLDNARIAERIRPMDTVNGFNIELASGVVAALITTLAPAQVIAAPIAGFHLYITDILVTCSHNSTGTYVVLQDGNGGTVIYKGYAAPGGGGFSVRLGTPLRLSSATALYAANLTNNSEVCVSASGYIGQ